MCSEIDHEATDGLRRGKHGKELETCENMTKIGTINRTTNLVVYRAMSQLFEKM
jgi:hypothetical protein